ncbi:hypothetical protein ACLOJK_015849 [Asimina triloba]
MNHNNIEENKRKACRGRGINAPSRWGLESQGKKEKGLWLTKSPPPESLEEDRTTARECGEDEGDGEEEGAAEEKKREGEGQNGNFATEGVAGKKNAMVAAVSAMKQTQAEMLRGWRCVSDLKARGRKMIPCSGCRRKFYSPTSTCLWLGEAQTLSRFELVAAPTEKETGTENLNRPKLYVFSRNS